MNEVVLHLLHALADAVGDVSNFFDLLNCLKNLAQAWNQAGNLKTVLLMNFFAV